MTKLFSCVLLHPGLRTRLPAALLMLSACTIFTSIRSLAQTPAQSPASPINVPAARASTGRSLSSEASVNPKDAPVIINGRPYVRPTAREQFVDYLKDSYGLPALARTSARALYAQGMDKPDQWGQDWAGFGQRFGSASAVTAIDGNVR
jgi:hypothetical protein